MSLSNENTQNEAWDQDELLRIKEYNTNIATIDPLYANVTPLSAYIVRVFLFEPKQEDGVLMPYKQLVSVPTANGQAEFAEIESPYPYSNKAIIVSTPVTSSLLKQGDVVQLASNPVKPQVQGRGHNATISIPAAYIHPNAGTFQIPTKLTDPNYGYLLIPIHEIIAKL